MTSLMIWSIPVSYRAMAAPMFGAAQFIVSQAKPDSEKFCGLLLTSSPAAYATLLAHFEETGRDPAFYDLIVTGDLGSLGREVVTDFFRRDGVELANYDDCGCLIFDAKKQDVHAGGSGCGCSAVVLTGYLLNGMREGRWNNVLFCPTGALLSPTSTLQGESIPSICHAVAISNL